VNRSISQIAQYGNKKKRIKEEKNLPIVTSIRNLIEKIIAMGFVGKF
jgi:hypothetical protein